MCIGEYIEAEMNERIQELALQAELNLELQSLKVEKFAKLLEQEFFSQGYLAGKSDGIIETVRECANVIEKRIGPKSALDVLEHFGIES